MAAHSGGLKTYATCQAPADLADIDENIEARDIIIIVETWPTAA